MATENIITQIGHKKDEYFGEVINMKTWESTKQDVHT